LADLADIDAGSWFGTSFKGEPIPTLAQVIETLGQLGLSANVEIKQHKHHKSLEQLTETVHAHLQRRSPQTRIVISSFDAEALKGMYRLEPSYDLAMLWSELPANWAELLEAIPSKTIHINYKALSIGFLEEAKRRGVLVRAWTCNTPELLASFWKAGLTGVITDDPRVFLT
jgi:glycerophosphoryl diester phosphodiesterase